MPDSVSIPENLRILEKNGERLLIATFYGENRPPEYAEYQQKVFDHFGIPLNQILADFSRCTHGDAIDDFLAKVEGSHDYLVLFDIDAIPLRHDLVEIAYDKIRDKRTVFGAAQQSNHIYVNGSVNHIYAGPCAFAISHEMYVALGRPTFGMTPRGDCAEEVTWRAEELGYNVCFMFPSHVQENLWRLGNGHQFGIGTTYGDLVFHAYLPANERSKQLFLGQCKRIISQTPRT